VKIREITYLELTLNKLR